MNYFIQASIAVVPLFVLIFSGWLLRKTKVINENFISKGSLIVFRLALPSLIIISMSEADFSAAANYKIIPAYLAATAVTYLIVLILSFPAAKPLARAPVIQGAFRSNTVIVGLALIQSSMGNSAFITGVTLIAVIIPVYNLMASVTLSFPGGEKGNQVKSTLISILKNPLIWSIAAGAMLSAFNIKIPVILFSSLKYMGQLALPLGLLTIGANITVHGVKERWKGITLAAAGKLIINPLLAVVFADFAGASAAGKAVVFIMAASPTAISSFAMTKAMGKDADAAADIVAITTALSLFTLTAGLTFLLRGV